MILPDLCEPVFLHLCRLSRHHRAGVKPTARQTRSELASILSKARSQASFDPDLLTQFNLVEPAILACIDRCIRASGWPCAEQWGSGADDNADRYFALLHRTLDDPSPEADERLEVLASCAALAFATPGLDAPRRDAIEQLRLRLAIDALDLHAHRTGPDTTDLTRPSARPVILFVALALSAIALASAALSARPAPRGVRHAVAAERGP